MSSFETARDHFLAHRLPEAEQACRAALWADSSSAELHALHGDVLLALQRPQPALAAFHEALQLAPRYFAAWYGSGCALLQLQEFAASLESWRHALALRPDHVPSLHNYAKSLFQLGDIEAAIQHFHAAYELDGNPHSLGALATSIPANPAATPSDILAARQHYAASLPAPAPPQPTPHPGPLRIGYLSSFFQSDHWMKPVWGLLNHHDRSRFELFLLSDAPRSACAGYQHHSADHFLDISALSNDEAADRIEQLHLDLLIDLNGYSELNRLALIARKPAPNVVGWFNLYATSGLPAYDYLIGDPHVVHPAEEPHYSETILRVPGSYLTFQVQYPVPDVAPPPFLSHGHLTFGCFASHHKLNPAVLAAWAEILRRAPHSRLVLKNSLLHRPSVHQHLLAAFQSHGIAPDRISCSGRAPHYDFLAAYADVDVALDPFPYNGGTTTMEALWQGVPVLCFDGDRWAARQGVSLLRNAGLPQFAAPNLPAYIDAAVALAEDPMPLATLRPNLRHHLQQASVCNSAAFARAMEDLYLTITTP
jgi:protein O-GlcNAc transferase